MTDVTARDEISEVVVFVVVFFFFFLFCSCSSSGEDKTFRTRLLDTFVLVKTRELMPSSCRVRVEGCQKLPLSDVENTQNSRAVGYNLEGWVQRVRGWGHNILKQTQN